MRAALGDLLATGAVLLADGATGTNYFEMGLESGAPPELWNVDRADTVAELHRRFVAAGADIVLTNTFGCNRYRLALHGAEHRVFELAKAAAAIARDVADAGARPIVVAGSVGPTGELLQPLGTLTFDDAVAAFRERPMALPREAPMSSGSRRCRLRKSCARLRPRPRWRACRTRRRARSTRPDAR
jgi:5-methyltetrahydrofolate--homocysteine methyltransferase